MNTGLLKGFRCPECGNERNFRIRVEILFVVYDDEDDPHERSDHFDWHDDSYCECWECNHEGVVKDFKDGSTE